jgi:hypothetical protein
MNEAVFRAEFVNIKPMETRDVCKIILEVDKSQLGQVLQAMGGLPANGESRWVAVARIQEDVKDQ